MQVLCILAYVRAVLHKRAIPNAFCPETENALITVPAKLSLSPTRHLCLVSAFFYFCCLYFCFLTQLPQPPLDSTTSERINKEVTWLWHIFFVCSFVEKNLFASHWCVNNLGIMSTVDVSISHLFLCKYPEASLLNGKWWGRVCEV